MKDIRCLLGKHKFGDWVEVGCHLERRCERGCGKAETKYPDPLVMLMKLGLEFLWYQKYHQKLGLLSPSKIPDGRWRDER